MNGKPPLVVFGRIVLLHHIAPRLSNYAFREWRETRELSIPIFSRTDHAILHWQKATSLSFVLMAQGRVRISQWPLFKPMFKWQVHCQWKWHQSRMGGISLKIEQKKSIGPLGIISSRKFIFIPLKWSMRKSASDCRWTSILQLFYCSEDNSLLKWDITQDTDGNISMTSPSAPSLWVGAEIKGSSVPVPWRLIPADSESY